MSHRRIGLVVAAAALVCLFSGSITSACPRDGTSGPCHCAERLTQTVSLINALTGAATPSAPATGSASSVSADVQSAASSEQLVHVYDFDFSTNPSGMPVMDATINVGDTVRWHWDGGFHSVTSVKGSTEAFDSGDHTPSFDFQHTFTHAGTFTYYCDIHGFDN